MKLPFVVLFFALSGTTFGRKITKDLLAPTDKECIKELGLKTQIIVDEIGEDFPSPEGDNDFNRFTACAFKKVKAIDENNEVNFDILKPILIELIVDVRDDIVEKQKARDDAVESCRDTRGSDVGDQMVKFLNCFFKYIGNVKREH